MANTYVNKLLIDQEIHDIQSIVEPPNTGRTYGRTVQNGKGSWVLIEDSGGGGGGDNYVTSVNNIKPTNGNVTLTAESIQASRSDSTSVYSYLSTILSTYKRIFITRGTDDEATAAAAVPGTPKNGDIVFIIKT